MPFPKVPPQGIWAPSVTFFDPETDNLLPDDQAKYFKHLSTTGLAGLVILGTNAETFLLTREERKQLLKIARQATGPDFPIMAGVSGHSTRQVLEFIGDAVEAGANYALVLPPAYFKAATSAPVIEAFYAEVAEKSKLPVVIYNFPGVCNGVDLDSDTIQRLAQKHENIVGVKLTCGSVAKITRLAAVLKPENFATFGGQSDFLVGGLAVGSAGCIAAFANVFPRALVKIYTLWKEGKTAEALELQQKQALAEQPCKAGIAVTKYAASYFTAGKAGVEGAEEKLKPRRPYAPPTQAVKDNVVKMLGEVAEVEATLV
ncbi:dihydrodipicolinate synthase [Pseudomassariella vexata]|uniref:Dihydrodipicolinate synthase n=1 Tax=Pseudomassariella vexata TaxID=1141098 RepID=A0A1Y2DEW6_9PEZI|nr:dihydrodipicolinate synthase [Pseudomassariella vexata]ORY57808.1 dihydrodipicolinate synthase [Pseudomassariella vexata]